MLYAVIEDGKTLGLFKEEAHAVQSVQTTWSRFNIEDKGWSDGRRRFIIDGWPHGVFVTLVHEERNVHTTWTHF
jgi:hypothetical protein